MQNWKLEIHLSNFLLFNKVLESTSKFTQVFDQFHRSNCVSSSFVISHSWNICVTWVTTFWREIQRISRRQRIRETACKLWQLFSKLVYSFSGKSFSNYFENCSIYTKSFNSTLEWKFLPFFKSSLNRYWLERIGTLWCTMESWHTVEWRNLVSLPVYISFYSLSLAITSF